MSGLQAQLEGASSKNQELLAIIAQTDYAPLAQKQNAIYLADLQESFENVKERLRKAHVMTEFERKGHTEMQESNVRRILHGLRGSKGKERFAAKQEKEERDFLERWHKEKELQERFDSLKAAFDNTSQHQKHLDQDSERNRTAQSELDKLYESLFGGPTPDVPGEDAQQAAVQQAQNFYDVEERATLPQRQALQYLQRAEQAMLQASAEMDQAWNQSRLDLFGAPTAIFEANCLSASSTAQGEARRLVLAARRLQPEVAEWRPLQPGTQDAGVEFWVLVSDHASHGRVQEWAGNCKRCCGELAREVLRQERRVERCEGRLGEARKGLDAARGELQRIRAEAFERVVGGAGGAGGYGDYGSVEQLPAYCS